MKTKNREKSKQHKIIWKTLLIVGGGIGSLVLLLAGTIAVRLAIATREAPEPQAILVLGGGTGREEFGAQFALAHPSLDVWISAGRFPQGPQIFRDAGIAEQKVHFDAYASDTVGNFAYQVKRFHEGKIQHVYLITSDYHMPRAQVIATLILGSQGIAFTPVSIPSNEPPESWLWLRIARDSCRSVLWIVTGNTGTKITKLIKN